MSETEEIMRQVDGAIRERVWLYNQAHDYLSPLRPRKLCWVLLGLVTAQLFSDALPFALFVAGSVSLVCATIDSNKLFLPCAKIDAHRLYTDPGSCARASVFCELPRLAPTSGEAKQRVLTAANQMAVDCMARGEDRTSTVEQVTQTALALLAAEATNTEW